MRAAVLLGALAACYHGDPAPAPVVIPPPPPEHLEPTCADAGIQLDRATSALRAPDRSFAPAMRDACREATWSQPAISCFATMTPDDLPRCMKLLSEHQASGVFEALSGTDRGSIEVALVKLAGMATGIPACDHFIATVALVLGCDAMPIETRVRLGAETADSWSLPNVKHLSADMLARMGASCQKSLDVLVAEGHRLACL